jgi:rhamnose utilization protein RhaD (predicted bifunctional aldolase and dehydrogenase)
MWIICIRTGRSLLPPVKAVKTRGVQPRTDRKSSGFHGNVGFELALLIESVVKDNPGVEGLILGGHGLFTWGMTQRGCYLNSIRTIDQMGEFIQTHQARKGSLFGGIENVPVQDRKTIAANILPALRGVVSIDVSLPTMPTTKMR